MSKRHALDAAAPWVELTTEQKDWTAADPDVLLQLLGRAQWIRSFEEYVLELAGQGLIHGPAHSSVGQEGGAVGSVLPLRSDDFVTGSHRGHHQFLAKAFGHVLEATPGELPHARRRGSRGAAQDPGRDLRPRRGLLPRPGRLDAPAVAGGRRDGHQRHRRRRRPPGRRLRVEHAARRHRRGLGHVLRRRRRQHRLGPGDLQPRGSLEAADLLLHREQPVRRLHRRLEVDRRAPTLGPRPRLRHPQLAGRRHGRAGGPRGDVRGGGPHARRRWPDHRRGRPLPLLPPERPLPRLRLRLPRQGRGEGLARARPDRPAHPGGRGPRPRQPGAGRRGQGPRGLGHEGDRRRPPRARAGRQARPAPHHRLPVARHRLRRRRHPR